MWVGRTHRKMQRGRSIARGQQLPYAQHHTDLWWDSTGTRVPQKATSWGGSVTNVASISRLASATSTWSRESVSLLATTP